MKRNKKWDIRGLEAFCFVTTFAVDVLCVLYLSNVMQYHWFLNFILILAVLLHVALAALRLLQDKKLLTAQAALFAAAFFGFLVYYNI